MPRISLALNQIENEKTESSESEEDITIPSTGSVFDAPYREIKFTVLAEDPILVERRQRELESRKMRKKEEKKKPLRRNEDSRRFSRVNIPKRSQSETKPRIKRFDSVEKNQSTSNRNPVFERLMQDSLNINKESPIKVKQTNNHIKKISEEASGAVFDRLFIESTMNTEKKTRNEDNSMLTRSTTTDTSDTAKHTRMIANKRIAQFIESLFPDTLVISLDEIQEIFTNLGIIDPNQSIEQFPIIMNTINTMKINKDKYNTEGIKDLIIQSIEAQKGRFLLFVKEKINLFLANYRNINNYEYERFNTTSQPAKKPTVISIDTILRLSTPSQDFSALAKEANKEDEKFQPPEMLPETKQILQKSKYGNSSFETRNAELFERAKQRVIELREQINKEYQAKRKPSKPIPKVQAITEDKKAQEQMKIIKEKLDVRSEPTFHPEIIKYSDFLPIKESMEKNKDYPIGFDPFCQRIKKGYEMHLKKKHDEKAILPLPTLAEVKRKEELAAAKRNAAKHRKPQKISYQTSTVAIITTDEPPIPTSRQENNVNEVEASEAGQNSNDEQLNRRKPNKRRRGRRSSSASRKSFS